VNLGRWAPAALAGVALLFAACSSSPSPSATSTTTTTAAHQSSSTSTTTTTTTAAATSSSTTSSTAAVASCSIKGASAQGQGAAGTITGTIVLTNTGSTPCTVNGYPTLALYSGSQAPLTVTMVNGLTVDVSAQANAGPTTVTIAAGGTAQFAYQYSDVPAGAQTSCPQSEAASATLPNRGGSSPTFPLTMSPCNNGTVNVSPVYATSG
jgi:Protein of unknown function (DUF4232)